MTQGGARDLASGGLLVVDKPPAHTSHDVVARCRKLLGTKRVGHSGTLDPDATGVLVVAFGKATRLIQFLQGLSKAYRGRVCFGVETDTLDAAGQVLGRHEMPLSRRQVEAVLGRFRGEIEQIPPMVSAIKVCGEPLYRRARRGEEIERDPRRLVIHSIDLEEFSDGPFPEAVIRVECSSGTYIRSLAADIGRALGGVAHLGELRRLAVGPFDESAASGIEVLEGLGASGRLTEAVIAVEDALPHLPHVEVDSARAEGVRHGTVFPLGVLTGSAGKLEGPVAVYGPGGELLAVYGPHRSGAKPICVFAG